MPDTASPDVTSPVLDVWLSFDDLRAAGIVASRKTLSTWQRDNNFPLGVLFSSQTRRWAKREIDAWLAKRPTAEQDKERLARRSKSNRKGTETRRKLREARVSITRRR
jgi:predicted DNA-binding transcriptional regulator AlpA